MAADMTMIPFERYDDEFTTLIQQIEQNLEQKDPPSTYTNNLLQQADDLLKQMALEARSISDNNLKRTLLDKVRTLKGQLQSLQTQYNRGQLMAPPSSSLSSMNNTDDPERRKRLLQQQQQNQKNEEMLLQQNDILDRARRTMDETETIALEITEELGNNREKLMATHGRIREVGGLTGRARKILYSMNQRAVQQKMIIYGVVTALTLGFLFLLYSLWG
jgi:Snare region anchored in the vesicle membrane C-terminus/Vesicle transport v-SNARE protein N-terminus